MKGGIFRGSRRQRGGRRRHRRRSSLIGRALIRKAARALRRAVARKRLRFRRH